MTGLQHALTCVVPDVHVTRGVTKALVSCHNCHAESWEAL